MNRYFLYLMLLNMMASTIIFVPKILLDAHFKGSVMAILIAIPIGTIFSYLLSKFMSYFPEQDLPEILEQLKHKWIKILILSILPVFWYSAGVLTLTGFTDILNRFINPEAPRLMNLALFLAALCLVIELPTQRVMYLLEIILFLNTPFIIFILYEGFTSDYMSWDSILEAATHVFERPSLKTVATAGFVFCGYSNLIIFNRLFKQKIKIWNFIAVFLLGTFNLLTTYFIPIGFHGIDGSHGFLYPWIITADSMRLVYSPIERAIFLFLMLYMSITLMSVAIHWHVGFEIINSLWNKKKSPKRKWIVILCFIAGTIPVVYFMNTIMLFQIAGYFMVFRLGAEVFIIALSFIMSRRTRTA
ncbi:GerAB/ArcD/ProY family transporter [Bacillus sp. BRMEA1]|uniref:GerAB/ArcD/ProY family transporter n=1 Tax=Neobacillus endophyticus TaxID=2738405 RepID=UPI00156611AA|nr:GerAB/ArcD/ProY family transporter [Neobacillus endophyticus]NRD79281.1 GerAB/ArcD/ProY family transporter [Neobacillus endophyticus]